MLCNCTQNAHVSALTQTFNPVTCSAAPGSRPSPLAMSQRNGGRTGNQPRCARTVCAAQDPQQPCVLLGPRRKVHLCVQLHKLDGPVRESVPARILALLAELVRALGLPMSHPLCHALAPAQSLGFAHLSCLWSVINRGLHFLAHCGLLTGRESCGAGALCQQSSATGSTGSAVHTRTRHSGCSAWWPLRHTNPCRAPGPAWGSACPARRRTRRPSRARPRTASPCPANHVRGCLLHDSYPR